MACIICLSACPSVCACVCVCFRARVCVWVRMYVSVLDIYSNFHIIPKADVS
jgi:hypothetical protein